MKAGAWRPVLQSIVLLVVVASLLSSSWFIKFFNHDGTEPV